MVHPPDLIPGVVLGEQIGVGARSAVHRGVRDGQEYAVKVLRDLGGPAEAVAFSREAALLAALGHPSLPSIHEVGTAAGHPYLIMDLVEGRSLAELLAEQGPLAERELVGLGMDVAGALAIAHAAGLVHRDIKPANIMIGLDGRATLIDFGLAARPGVAEADDAVVGTFVYSAPEQTGMLRRAVDARSDLYSLGAVFFESLTGGPPFAVRDVGELVRRHLSVPAPDVRHLAPAVSPRLAAIVARLLAKDPDDRYQTARELLADLGRLPTSPAGPLPLAAPAVRTPPLLVGRDTELAALLTQYRQASAGGGRVVVLEGPPGIGKSSLLTALARSVAAAPALVLRGGCLPDGALPLAPLREAVEHYVATLDDLPEPTRTTALRRLRTAAGSTGAAVLGRFSPVLAQVLVEPGRASREPEGVTEQQFVDTLAGFVSGLAGDDRSAVLLLDDVQWWDKATREVMRRVVAMLPRTRLLLVLAVRDDGAARQVLESVVDVGPVSLRLPVPPLDERATSALLAARLGSARAPANLIARLSARAGGNPLALVELAGVLTGEQLADRSPLPTRQVQFRGVPVRAASATWTIACEDTAASEGLSSSDWCSAPATTRWMLLLDSAARAICGVSQPVCAFTGAVSTYSGRSPRVVMAPAWAIIVGTMASSSRWLRACPAVAKAARACCLACAGSSGWLEELISWVTPRRARPGNNPVAVVNMS